MIAPLLTRVLEVASLEVGIRELGRNRGPRVDQYIRAAGLDPERGSYPWCVCFIQWCFQQAAKDLGTESPLPRTASVHKLWAAAPACRTVRPYPGRIFLLDHGAGTGHAGLVEAVTGTHAVTVEGNTSADGAREGDGVFRRVRRFDGNERLLGFLDFGATTTEAVT